MAADEDSGRPAAFLAALARNATLQALLERLASTSLPQWYVTGGCLFQTVWNRLCGLPASQGIRDYDVFYFDAGDLSADGEQQVARAVRRLAGDLPFPLDVRNQARVHLWYERDFGAPSPPFGRCEDGIDHFLAPCCAFGVHTRGGAPQVHAPFGYTDLFDFVLRPSPRRIDGGAGVRAAYERKAAHWRQLWPRLTVVPWPSVVTGDAP